MIYLDTETYSPTPIKFGLDRYFHEAEVLLVTFAADDLPVECVDIAAGEGLPDWLLSDLHHLSEEKIVAHNADFDRRALLKLGVHIPSERWVDSAALARAAGLPGNLDGACKATKVPEEYSKKEGGKLINLFCSPAPKNHKADRYDRRNRPTEWERFKEYAIHDVVAMRELYRRLPKAYDL